MSSSNYCFLTCIQISQEAGQVVWYSHLFKNFLQFVVIHTVKGFGIVNKAEIGVLLELSRFFDNPTDIGNSISGSSAFSNTSLNIWKFTVHILLKPGSENFEHYFTSVWDECNCAVVWAIFGIAFQEEQIPGQRLSCDKSRSRNQAFNNLISRWQLKAKRVQKWKLQCQTIGGEARSELL